MKKLMVPNWLLGAFLLSIAYAPAFGQGYGTSRTEVREGDPRVTFVSFKLQTEIAQGELVRGSLFFKVNAPLEENLKVFFHLTRPGQDQTALNADFSPRYPTRLWDVNQIVEAGPFELGIPLKFEPGEYDIRSGLLRIVREEDVVRYVREPYTNAEIQNFVIGKLTVKGTEAPEASAPSEFDLIAFDNEAEIIFWETLGAKVEAMDYSEEDGQSVSAARVTVIPGTAEYPGVALQNFFQIRPGRGDWSTYDILRLRLFRPAVDGAGRVVLKITDGSGRSYQKDITLVPGKAEQIDLPTIDLSGAINVTAISRIQFFLVNPSSPFTFFISGLRLISRGQPTGQPAVTFVRMEAPPRIQRGRPFQVKFFFKILQPIFPRHKMFVHLYRVNDLAGRVGSDVNLAPPIRNWPLEQEVAVDSGPLMIPEGAPPGTYVVRAGLYMVADSPGRGYVKIDDWEAYGDQEVSNIFQPSGPVDYIKQPYSNLEIRDWEVGTIEVE